MQLKCNKDKENRKELKILHTAGSKAFVKVQYDEVLFIDYVMYILIAHAIHIFGLEVPFSWLCFRLS